MKKLLVAIAAVAAFALVGQGVEVSTVEALTAALAGSESEIVIAEGTYTITAALSVSRAVTVRAADGASVTIDANSKCQCLSLNHADAVVEGIRFYRGKVNAVGAGVAIGANGGTLRNCIVESCRVGNASKGPGIYMNSANALVTGCQVRNCGTNGFNGDYECHGVYIDNGTLDHTLVVGCKNTDTYADGKKGTAAVYLAKGTVKNCTIVGNEVSHYGLYCADADTCHVIDTISWGNVSLRGVDANCPNANDIGANADVVNLCLDNPMFANMTDYALAPDSPSIGAGTDGCDLGWTAYDATVPAIGVKVSASKGMAPLEVTVELTANVSVASVVWEGVEASGTSFTTTLGGGNHRIKATATLAGGGTLTAENVVEVTYPAGEYEVSDVETLEWMLSSPLADGVVINLADGNYPITANCYALRSGVKVVGTSRENTVISKAKGATGRFFYVNHKDAELDNLTVTGGSSGGSAGGIWIDGRGGTVSNCTVRSCKAGASQPGGGVWLNSADALITHSVISGNAGGQNGHGGGVYLSYGTLADSLVISNSVTYWDQGRKYYGAGIYMDKATADAKVVNCTVARNSNYYGSGIYRTKNSGFVYNTLVYDNVAYSAEKDANILSDGGTDRPDSVAFQNCCSSTEIGTNPQAISALPFNPATYELDASTGGACIDKGANEFVVSTTDFYGNDRIFQGKTVDIGAHEYSKTTVEVGFTSSATKGVDSVTVTLTATVLGADVTDDDIAWYVDGGEEPVGIGRVYVHVFGVGRHSIRMTVDVGGTIYEKVSDDKTGVVVYPSDVYVEANSTVEPVWPYPATAPATNLNDAVTNALISGVTIHIAAGSYRIVKTILLEANMHLVGAGADETVIWANRSVSGTGGDSGIRILQMNGTNTSAENLCVSNGCDQGAGVYISGAGGTFADGRIVDMRGVPNHEGACAYLSGSGAKVVRSVISGGTYPYDDQTSRDGHKGAGAYVKEGAVLEDCLVIGNRGNYSAGVYCDGGHVRNCTILDNASTLSGETGGVGGSGSVVNCIIRGNTDKDGVAADVSGAEANFKNCCIPTAYGDPCVTADPQFKDAENGDYRIGASSPCAYAGKWEEWMDGATDFFGNPRATPGKKVSIGYCQSPNPGLMLLVR